MNDRKNIFDALLDPEIEVQEPDMRVLVILDASGSMQTMKERAVRAYNDFVRELERDEAVKYRLSLLLFSGLGAQFLWEDAEGARLLEGANYVPNGDTPLYDAVGDAVSRLSGRAGRVFVAIITDGEENASREWSFQAVKDLIAEKEREGWRFMFLAANLQAWQQGTMLVGAQGTGMYDNNYAMASGYAAYSVVAAARGQERLSYTQWSGNPAGDRLDEGK